MKNSKQPSFRFWQLVLLLALSSLTAANLKDQTYSGFEQKLANSVREYKLENGLQFIAVERQKSPTLSLFIRFKVGSVDESYTTTGTAHLLEHMLFKGTEEIGTKNWQQEKLILDQIQSIGRKIDIIPEKDKQGKEAKVLQQKLKKLQQEHKQFVVKDAYDNIYNRNGGSGFNASTSCDITTYKINLPKNRLQLWAYLESERLRNPVLREYYTERNVVLEERRMRIDSKGSGLLYEAFMATAFMAHPYQHPIIGWQSVIPDLRLSETKQFFLNFYSPNNMVITIVGDIKAEESYKIIKKYFGRLDNGHPPRRHAIQEPKQLGERRVTIKHHDNPEILIGFHKPNMPAREDYVFDILSNLLTNGRSSFLHKKLVLEKKMALYIRSYASFPGSRYHNLFVLSAAPQSNVSIQDLEDQIHASLIEFIKKPIADRDLQKVKNQLEADFIYGLQSNTGLASSISYYQTMLGDWQYMLDYRSNIETIKQQEIIEVAKKYLVQTNRTVAILEQRQTAHDKKTPEHHTK